MRCTRRVSTRPSASPSTTAVRSPPHSYCPPRARRLERENPAPAPASTSKRMRDGRTDKQPDPARQLVQSACSRFHVRTHVRPIATDTSCCATSNPDEYASVLPSLDCTAKLRVSAVSCLALFRRADSTHLKIPPFDNPDGSCIKIPTTVTGKLDPCALARTDSRIALPPRPHYTSTRSGRPHPPWTPCHTCCPASRRQMTQLPTSCRTYS
jgi:hypothetical protein